MRDDDNGDNDDDELEDVMRSESWLLVDCFYLWLDGRHEDCREGHEQEDSD